MLFGQTQAMRSIRERLERVADAGIPILIQGESGTGKEVLARYTHWRSNRRNCPFVKVNCPAIPAELFESELFGYEQGAFTGAATPKPGWVENANSGTLFLDEVAELPLGMQAKLLHLLQNGQFARLGSVEDRRIEVRLISATSRRLEEEIDLGSFRKDLFYRINVVGIQLPPLRERRADIPELADHFLRLYSNRYGTQAQPLSPSLLQLLLKHDWPGNIRELENVIRRHVVLGAEAEIGADLLKLQQSGKGTAVRNDGSTSLKKLTRQAVRELERKIILDTLDAHNWSRKDAARALDISYRALFYKIKQAGLPSKKELSVRAPAGPNGDDLKTPKTGRNTA